MCYWDMETLYPSTYTFNPNWLSPSTKWTIEENKRFESALAIIEEQDPDRWIKVAAFIPGKTVADVIKQYRELLKDVSDIEAGKVPIPGYLSSSFTLELVDHRDFDGYRKRPLVPKSPAADQERKKGVPWTEEEHRRFLMGLLKHGKGDWRNISRNFVVTKTPTQVASHAQKYFIRQQLNGVKDKRRPSIHDITTFNITETTTTSTNPSDANNNLPSSLDQSDDVLLPPKPPRDGSSIMVFDSASGNLFMSEAASHGLKFYGQNVKMGVHPGIYFQMPGYHVH